MNTHTCEVSRPSKRGVPSFQPSWNSNTGRIFLPRRILGRKGWKIPSYLVLRDKLQRSSFRGRVLAHRFRLESGPETQESLSFRGYVGGLVVPMQPGARGAVGSGSGACAFGMVCFQFFWFQGASCLKKSSAPPSSCQTKSLKKNDAGLDCTVWFGDTEAEVNTDRPKKLGCCSVWPQWL